MSLLVINRGRLVAEGPPRELVTRNFSNYALEVRDVALDARLEQRAPPCGWPSSPSGDGPAPRTWPRAWAGSWRPRCPRQVAEHAGESSSATLRRPAGAVRQALADSVGVPG